MEAGIQKRVEMLNQRYHRIINGNAYPDDEIEFRALIGKLRTQGYRFKVGAPNDDFRSYHLNDFETKLFIRLGIIQLLKINAKSEGLFWFFNQMWDAERALRRQIYVSLCQREIRSATYFLLRGKSKIDFMQSGHKVDIYPLFNQP